MVSSIPSSILTTSLTGSHAISAYGARIAPSSVDVAFVREASRVAQARRIGAAWLRNVCRVPQGRVDSAEVVISELVSNAIVHGRGSTVGLRLRRTAGQVRLEVDDRSPSAVPGPQQAGVGAERGRGLWLVKALVDELDGSWGFTTDGTVAWCVFPVGPGSSHENGRRTV
ncbi:ATP-binding protein [Streptomyces pacificus]|uniref:ATP-binding protein n=2 Tax=Streptomyces pacificus TaxID=2705029 RepID=A0A6A0B2D2_9ACTN|nr:ATP-binding protein [Streptomyces pacificus]